MCSLISLYTLKHHCITTQTCSQAGFKYPPYEFVEVNCSADTVKCLSDLIINANIHFDYLYCLYLWVLIWFGNTKVCTTEYISIVMIWHIQNKLFWFLLGKRKKNTTVSNTLHSEALWFSHRDAVCQMHHHMLSQWHYAPCRPARQGRVQITNLRTRSLPATSQANSENQPYCLRRPSFHLHTRSKVVRACLFSDSRGTRILFVHLSVTQTMWGKRGG